MLQYLRTRDIDLRALGGEVRWLRHEAEYYNVAPLVRRLMLCEDLTHSSCGDVLFYGCLMPPSTLNFGSSKHFATSLLCSIGIPIPDIGATVASDAATPSDSHASAVARPPSTARLPEHARQPSWDQRIAVAHSRQSSVDMRANGIAQAPSSAQQHSRNSSADLNAFMRNDASGLAWTGGWASAQPPLRAQIIKAHHNWIACAYPHFVTCYALKDSAGWQLVFQSPHIEAPIERLAINAKLVVSSGGEQVLTKMVAIAGGQWIRLWRVGDAGECTEVGVFSLSVRVEFLFFIGSQLVALSSSGKIGVWHAMTQHWQCQDMEPILSFDTAGSFLLLGCNNGSIYYIGELVF